MKIHEARVTVLRQITPCSARVLHFEQLPPSCPLVANQGSGLALPSSEQESSAVRRRLLCPYHLPVAGGEEN